MRTFITTDSPYEIDANSSKYISDLSISKWFKTKQNKTEIKVKIFFVRKDANAWYTIAFLFLFYFELK